MPAEPRTLCPHLDRRDPRCAERLTMTNVGEAFRFCAGSYESCITYHQIRVDQHERSEAGPLARSA